ncbi:uncharacterized protein METZ01_LOCUS101105 [marine metagenome]|uniref:Uncharacterized protein n=1 Tax=marine metagenome TaxID=408172 RepID=A0A381W7I7_9ZZZZ
MKAGLRALKNLIVKKEKKLLIVQAVTVHP